MNKGYMININMKKYTQVTGFIGISLCLRMKKAYIVKQLCPWENMKGCTMDECAISFEILLFNFQFFIHYTIFNFSTIV